MSNAESADPQDYVSPPFLVVAVGASAGGLEAFSALLGGMPSDAPLAIVLVQHLSRTHESQLPEILATRTALHVLTATDGMRVESGHVYVISPDTQMTVIDGHLRVRQRPEGYFSAQIDALFRSLAEFYGGKAVGVVLSGALHDGAEGFRAIRAAGGVTFAQLPEEAQTESMPRAAIATGDVDRVLPARKIGEELLLLAALPAIQGRASDPAWRLTSRNPRQRSQRLHQKATQRSPAQHGSVAGWTDKCCTQTRFCRLRQQLQKSLRYPAWRSSRSRWGTGTSGQRARSRKSCT